MVTALPQWIKPQVVRSYIVTYEPSIPTQDVVDAWIEEFECLLHAAIPSTASVQVESTEARFRRLAKEWSSEVGTVSSISAMTSHPKYQEIVDLGWDVVPFLLTGLQKGGGFWFTALHRITGIRPFDPSEAGNYPRMREAWIKWGQWKGIV